MLVDPLVLPTFLMEADSYLQVLRDPNAGTRAWYRAVQGLLGAASVMELIPLIEIARRIETRLAADSTANLAQEVESVGDLLTELHQGNFSTAPNGADAFNPPLLSRPGEKKVPSNTDPESGHRKSAIQEQHSRVDPPPEDSAASDSSGHQGLSQDGWDEETTMLLRSFFLEEARQHLEAMAVAFAHFDGTWHSPSVEEILRKTHTLKGAAHTVGLHTIGEAAHLLEDLFVGMQKQQRDLSTTGIEYLTPLTDLLRSMVESVNGLVDGSHQWIDPLRKMLLEIQTHGLDSPPGERRVPAPSAPSGLPLLGLAKNVSTDLQKSASSEQNRLQSDRRLELDRRAPPEPHVRVKIERLEDMINAVGELVIHRTRFDRRIEELRGLTRDLRLCRQTLHSTLVNLQHKTQTPTLMQLREVEVELAEAMQNLDHAVTDLAEDSDALRRTSHTLSEHLSQIRMMPIHWLYTRLQRPMCELAESQGKQITLQIDDESTGMDRTVAEQVIGALIQLIRNAVVHGIEEPARRRLAGKPETGRIRISARHLGDFITIEVEDDGAGILPEELRAALKSWGRLDARQVDLLTDEEVIDHIFVSGFSTRLKADQWAGRGVGLDAVREDIVNLGGSIQVQSRPSLGTTFTIRLPMFTSIAQALLFKVDDDVYAIPVVHVTHSLSAEPSRLREKNGLWSIQTSEEWIPLLELHPLLGKTPPSPLSQENLRGISHQRQSIIVLTSGELRFGITCTRIIGPREIVIKRLGRLLGAMPLFAGATLSGANKVQFILNVAVLARLVSAGLTHNSKTKVNWPKEVIPAVSPPRRILVADDSRAIREATSLILRNAGYTVDTAPDGWEAWELLQARSYTLLLTDLEMPRLHGHELIAKCRKTTALARMPILVLTSKMADHQREMVLQRGANAFLTKPIRRRVLLEEIERLLQTAGQ